MIGDAERLEALERTLAELIELNETMPAIVEGKRDVVALRALGLTGEIFVVHAGQALIDLADRLAARYSDVILLTDWDRTGGSIMRHLRENLKGRVEMHREIRRALAVWSEVRDVESLPAYLDTLRRHVSLSTRDVHGAHPRGEG